MTVGVEPKLTHLGLFTLPSTGTWSVSDGPNGSKLLLGVPIFRSGTFRDSMGLQRTWDPEHLFQMVQNFDALKRKEILPNVPVRVDHSFSAEKIMGWISTLSVNGEFLAADLAITEPDQFDKIQRGTYRNRSLEVGMYETNDEQMYWPVVMGVAFVDLPAVEGLHHGSFPVTCFSAIPKEPDVSTDPNATHQQPPPNTNGPGTPPADAGAARPPAPPTVATFRVNGADVTDVGAVQRHIDALEKFATDSREAARTAYIAGLATSKKITQPQVEGLTALVQTMSDEQYDKFKASYDAAPVLSLLGDHANGVTNPNGDQGVGTDPVKERIAVLTETVTMLRRSGLTDEQIAKSPSAKELAAIRSGGQV